MPWTQMKRVIAIVAAGLVANRRRRSSAPSRRVRVAVCPAGDEGGRQIRASAPYEGEETSKARRNGRSNTRRFLEEHPHHPNAPEAMLNVATRVWARGRLPELFHYIFAPHPVEWAAFER